MVVTGIQRSHAGDGELRARGTANAVIVHEEDAVTIPLVAEAGAVSIHGDGEVLPFMDGDTMRGGVDDADVGGADGVPAQAGHGDGVDTGISHD